METPVQQLLGTFWPSNASFLNLFEPKIGLDSIWRHFVKRIFTEVHYHDYNQKRKPRRRIESFNSSSHFGIFCETAIKMSV